MNPWIRIAHRGASGIAPENTIAAFKKAIEIGVDAVELDLQGTADGEVVVIHDASLDRTTDQSGQIKDSSLETIKQADAGTWFDTKFAGESVPTLAEALVAIADNAIALLEIKDVSVTESVVRIVQKMDMVEQSVIISFNSSAIQTVRSLEPRLPTGYIIGSKENIQPIQLCQQLGLLGSNLLNVDHRLVTEDFIYEIRRRGITLWCWTVDDMDRMRELQEFGIQGITSNRPEYFSQV
ncbi:hypothetical protein JT359_00195 [Candidatus Poribacteria bacterium]|nr:hypothetical protein [Candidatus Poribacteria bacterium]